MTRENTFRFKQFAVLNDKTAMKVGTDGVLLGAWCDVREAKSVLDVGTGCGLIALMIAQRNADCDIDCIDIDEGAIEEAKINADNSPWSDRIHPFMSDFKQFICNKKYDLIVSNPPFFNNGVLAPDKSRQNARHTVELSFEQLIHKAISLLSDKGKLCLISPTDAEEEITKSCTEVGAYVNQKVVIYTKPGKEPKRCLWEISKHNSDKRCSELFVQNSDGQYSEQYIGLCKDFYMSM